MRIQLTEKERETTSLGLCLHPYLLQTRLLALMRIRAKLGPYAFLASCLYLQ